MGQRQSQSTTNTNILNTVLSPETFENLLHDNYSRIQLHNMAYKANKPIKVFLCNNPVDTNVYYGIEFVCINLGPPSVGHLLWAYFVYHEYWTYGFHIYEYNTTTQEKQYVIKNLSVSHPSTRPGYHISNDFVTNYNVVKTFQFETIQRLKSTTL